MWLLQTEVCKYTIFSVENVLVLINVNSTSHFSGLISKCDNVIAFATPGKQISIQTFAIVYKIFTL